MAILQRATHFADYGTRIDKRNHVTADAVRATRPPTRNPVLCIEQSRGAPTRGVRFKRRWRVRSWSQLSNLNDDKVVMDERLVKSG